MPDLIYDVILSPGLWLSLVLALTYGTVVYGWRGGGWHQLRRDLLAAVVGFAAGQVIGIFLEVDLLQVGQIQLLTASAGSWLALLLGRWVRRRWERGDNKNKQKVLYRNR